MTEVAADVLRMELPVSIRGLRHVNCDALLDDDGAAVFDPGLPGASTRKALNYDTNSKLPQAGCV